MRFILFDIPMMYPLISLRYFLVWATIGAVVGLQIALWKKRWWSGLILLGGVGGISVGVTVTPFFGIPWKYTTIPVMGYGMMIVLGFISGIALAHWRARRCRENPEHIVNLGLQALVGGIVGARLLYILINFDQFTGFGLRGNLGKMVNVKAGGLVYYGGLILAVVICMVYIRRKKLAVRRILDIVAPSLMIGLAFGRAGCTLNGCCWGGACELESPIARQVLTITFPYGSPAFDQHARKLPWRVVGEDGTESFYVAREMLSSKEGEPLFLHFPAPPGERPPQPWVTFPREFLVQSDGEVPDLGHYYYFKSREDVRDTAEHRSLAREYRSLSIYAVQPMGIINGLLLCLVLNVFFGYRKREGQVFALLLLTYPISRFLLEGIRQDTDPVAFGLTLSQNISMWLFLGGVVMWWALSRLPAVVPVPLSGTVPGQRPEDRKDEKDKQ